MVAYEVRPLFGSAEVTGTPAGPRPRQVADVPRSGAAEFIEILPGTWSVCVFQPIPKIGFDGIDFPHYWGERDGGTAWRVARHGEVPDATFIFTSQREALDVVAEVFGDAQDLCRFMGWIEIPTDDQRRYAHRRTPR